MKKFRFSLETVLDYKQQVLESLQIEHAAIQAKVRAQEERLRGLEKKSRPVEEKMEEIRLVNRAKWLLIRELKMSEPDAHHYITHQAMDRCCSKRAVAEEIVRLYT